MTAPIGRRGRRSGRMPAAGRRRLHLGRRRFSAVDGGRRSSRVGVDREDRPRGRGSRAAARTGGRMSPLRCRRHRRERGHPGHARAAASRSVSTTSRAISWPVPTPHPSGPLAPGRLAGLRVSARLLDAECPITVIEDIIRGDPAMSHQLLQLAGAGAAGGMKRTVRTLRQALVLVGWRRLQSWVALLLLDRRRLHLRGGDRHRLDAGPDERVAGGGGRLPARLRLHGRSAVHPRHRSGHAGGEDRRDPAPRCRTPRRRPGRRGSSRASHQPTWPTTNWAVPNRPSAALCPRTPCGRRRWRRSPGRWA